MGVKHSKSYYFSSSPTTQPPKPAPQAESESRSEPEAESESRSEPEAQSESRSEPESEP